MGPQASAMLNPCFRASKLAIVHMAAAEEVIDKASSGGDGADRLNRACVSGGSRGDEPACLRGGLDDERPVKPIVLRRQRECHQRLGLLDDSSCGH